MRLWQVLLIVSVSLSHAGYFDTLSPGTWTKVTPLSVPPLHAGSMGFEKCDFADAINSHVFFGGFNNAGSEPQNALWAYSASENRWRILDVSYTVTVKGEYTLCAGHDRSLCYDSRLHAIFELNVYAMGGNQTGLLQYDVRGNTGRCYWPNRSYLTEGGGGSSCFNPDDSCIYYFSRFLRRLSRCHLAENRWDLLATPPVLAEVAELSYAIAFDRLHKKLVVFSADNQVWSYDPAVNHWDSVATSSHVSTEFPNLIWNDILKKFVVFDKATRRTWTYDLGGNEWKELCPISADDINNGSSEYGLTYSPYDNLHMNMKPAGDGGNYCAAMFVMRDSNRTLQPLPVFEKTEYAADPAWFTVGTPFRNDSNGYAHFPVLAVHQGVPYVAFEESRASLNNDAGLGMVMKRWNGAAWETAAAFARDWQQSVSLFSDGLNLYAGADGVAIWHGNRSFALKVGTGRLDSVGNQSYWDFNSLPYLVRYKGALHAIHMGDGTNGEMDHLHHAVLDSASNTWRHVDSITSGYKPNDMFERPGQPLCMRYPFSVAALGDSLFVATTDMFMRSYVFDTLPLVVNVRCYDGTRWDTLPRIHADRKTMMATHPTLAATPDGRYLYLAYLKRPYAGRKNNEVFVERWNGNAWETLGGSLNVNGQDMDAWSYRPCIAVNSAGVPYVAWNEHVWGSCAQVYVKHWDGAQWISDVAAGASLNIDGKDGAAQSVSIAFVNDTPMVCWSEYSYGREFFRKIVVKRFSGPLPSPIEAENPESQPLLTVSPNPFNPTVNIRYSLPHNSKAEYRIMDAQGRTIAVYHLFGGARGAKGAFQWNSRDMQGRPVSSGIYFGRLITNTRKRLTNKLMLMK